MKRLVFPFSTAEGPSWFWIPAALLNYCLVLFLFPPISVVSDGEDCSASWLSTFTNCSIVVCFDLYTIFSGLLKHISFSNPFRCTASIIGNIHDCKRKKQFLFCGIKQKVFFFTVQWRRVRCQLRLRARKVKLKGQSYRRWQGLTVEGKKQSKGWLGKTKLKVTFL